MLGETPHDAADLCGLTEPTDIVATDDIDAVEESRSAAAGTGGAYFARPDPPGQPRDAGIHIHVAAGGHRDAD
jgi:hypothetical protein